MDDADFHDRQGKHPYEANDLRLDTFEAREPLRSHPRWILKRH